jgi:hypothetical protein
MGRGNGNHPIQGDRRISRLVYAVAWIAGVAASAAVIWLIESLD